MRAELLGKLEKLGEKYLAARTKADAYGTLRHSLGQRIVKICAKHGKRRTKIPLDGTRTMVIGYDEVVTYKVDSDALRSVLGDELWEQVTSVAVNHDKLARVLESGDLSTEQYRKVKRCVTEEVSNRPHVRKV